MAPVAQKLLIVEDDPSFGMIMAAYLDATGYKTVRVTHGRDVFGHLDGGGIDAILLDLNLPDEDGLVVMRCLRARSEVPIVIVSGRQGTVDRLTALEMGADDYLVKPFALREVEARLLALHKRRSGKVADPELRVGELVFDTDRLKIVFAGEPVRLPPKSMRLLECMMARPHHVFSRAELELAIWGEEQATSDTLRSHMHTLRRALARAGGFDPIESVHGIGYRLVAHNAH